MFSAGKFHFCLYFVRPTGRIVKSNMKLFCFMTSPPYHRLVSDTLRLILLAIISREKLIAELKSPMAVE